MRRSTVLPLQLVLPGFVIYGLRGNLVCLFKLECFCPRQKSQVYYEICPPPTNYESVMFYSTGPSNGLTPQLIRPHPATVTLKRVYNTDTLTNPITTNKKKREKIFRVKNDETLDMYGLSIPLRYLSNQDTHHNDTSSDMMVSVTISLMLC